MPELYRDLIRIMKGPTGGLLTSLALAAFLGGVAIAAPGPSLEPARGTVMSEVRNGVQPPNPGGASPTSHGSDLPSTAHDRTVDWPAQTGAGDQGGDDADAQAPQEPAALPTHADGPAERPRSRATRPNDPAGPGPSQDADREGSPNQPSRDQGSSEPSGLAGAHGDAGDANRS